VQRRTRYWNSVQCAVSLTSVLVSDQDAAGRWLSLFTQRRNKDGSPAKPERQEIEMIVKQPMRRAVAESEQR
jgi:hypothetical protein